MIGGRVASVWSPLIAYSTTGGKGSRLPFTDFNRSCHNHWVGCFIYCDICYICTTIGIGHRNSIGFNRSWANGNASRCFARAPQVRTTRSSSGSGNSSGFALTNQWVTIQYCYWIIVYHNRYTGGIATAVGIGSCYGVSGGCSWINRNGSAGAPRTPHITATTRGSQGSAFALTNFGITADGWRWQWVYVYAHLVGTHTTVFTDRKGIVEGKWCARGWLRDIRIIQEGTRRPGVTRSYWATGALRQTDLDALALADGYIRAGIGVYSIGYGDVVGVSLSTFAAAYRQYGGISTGTGKSNRLAGIGRTRWGSWPAEAPAVGCSRNSRVSYK